MKREYFLTTERLGFSWWTGEDLELAKSLWGDPQVCRYICAAGQFSDDEVRKRMALEMENGQRHQSSTGRCLNWKQEGWPDAAA